MRSPAPLAIFGAVVASLALAGCGKDDAPKPSASASAEHSLPKPPHGGAWVEVGEELAHLEIVHDPAAGTLALHAYGGDAKTPSKLEAAPVLNLVAKDGPVEVTMVAVVAAAGSAEGASWTASHAALKSDPLVGRIRVKIDGKTWNPEFPAEDGHGH